ncbi:hypothetical protein C484_18377 [Natrialba taiwanensis DSM 12281]|uniref:Uncharacterized protein n=2 Tax=Natrialba taiwanensis TaxID=160846 RepID=L9ZIV9_9EURY|nr:hypothetical protein C484_18377 [Natrialba taiwanensis DSM 12281]
MCQDLISRRDIDIEDFERLTVDHRPDRDFFVVDKVKVDSYLLSLLVARLEHALELVKPLSDRLIGPINERFNPSVRKASMIQKCCEDTPPCRRVFSRRYPTLLGFPNYMGKNYTILTHSSTKFLLSY